jgi:hypothetical protein
MYKEGRNKEGRNKEGKEPIDKSRPTDYCGYGKFTDKRGLN